MRIYDCFTFYNELELLEIRLAELADVVDVFVIAEATVTFQGHEKPLYFADNREQFTAYAHKIRHIVVDDMPSTPNPWERERHQRNSLKRGLVDADLNDMVIISDADEICTHAALTDLKARSSFTFIQMRMFAYFLNCEVTSGNDIPWIKVYGAPAVTIKAMPDLTAPRDGNPKTHPQKYLKSMRLGSLDANRIRYGGWHFSWLGDADRLMNKLSSFSHTEAHVQKWRDRDFISRAIANRCFFPSGAKLAVRKIGPDFPTLVRKFEERYLRENLLAAPVEKRPFLSRILRRST